jgi:polysaccharide biosynthesis transport protein
MELRNYLNIVKRWFWLLVVGLILGCGIAYSLSARQTPIFQSSTKLLVSRAPENKTDYTDYWTDQQLAQTYIQLLTTQPVLDAASGRLGYPVTAGQVSASLIKDTRIIRVAIEDSNPVRTADIANTLMSVLIEQNEKLQSGQFAQSEESLQTQLKQVESQIASLQLEVGKVSGESLQNQLSEVKDQIDTLQTQILRLQGTIHAPRPTQLVVITPTAQLTSTGKVDPQKPTETQAAVILYTTPTLRPDESQAIQQNQFEMDQAQRMLTFYQEIYTNLVTSSVSKDSGQGLDQKQNTLVLYQQIYSNLLSSYESVRLARLVSTPNIVQVERGSIPTNPIRPRPINDAGIGGAIGLMIAAMIIFLVEYLDDSIKLPDDISRITGVPVIGYIAEMDHSKTKGEEVYVASKPRAAITEAFRSLRTNISFSEVDRLIQTILVTSPTPEDGKTTIAVNLAMIMAQSGKKTILVDADLRRPRCHRFLGLPNREGLSDIFLSHQSAEVVTREWKKDSNLSVITSGKLPPNPSELLGSEKMLRILDELKGMADVIIIDSPPFLVSDPSVLASIVDGVVLIVKPGVSRTESIRAIVDQLQRVNAKVLGIVFNRIPRNRGYYYGGYSYYSGYYYRSKYGATNRYYDEDHRWTGSIPGRIKHSFKKIFSSRSVEKPYADSDPKEIIDPVKE